MDPRKKIAQLVIARLDGADIRRKFKYYLSLTKQGIGGFIVFGGELNEVSRGVNKLQGEADVPLFIASDLEQGLGQQIHGGTLFPTAMAFGQAVDRRKRADVGLLRRSACIMADEITAAGFNIVFAPVLDVNTNPKNPIICTRAYSDDPGEVAWFGKELIKSFQSKGLIACAKHFPGHGDTEKDSHRELPVVRAGAKRLSRVELYPFAAAVRAGVRMVMVGHLKVPALDPKHASTFSVKIIRGVLRDRMGFKGLVITDAMNMHAVSGKRQEKANMACLKALRAGADILLHPHDPEAVIDHLCSSRENIMPGVNRSLQRILRAKKRFAAAPPATKRIGRKSHWEAAGELTRRSILTSKKINMPEPPAVLIVDDDNNRSGKPFVNALKKKYRKIKFFYVDNKSQLKNSSIVNRQSSIVIAVFSKVSAWKGRSGLSARLRSVLEKAVKASGYSVIAGFCCPYVINNVKADVIVRAYSGSEQAQEAAAGAISGRR